jgi:uncharacterized protein (DUF305 family)
MARQKVLFFGALAVVAALIIVGFAVNALWDRAPGDNSPEAGFLRDMQVHHTQAVEMAMIIRDRTQDEQIQAMATDIAFSQTSQIGQMQGYMRIWELNPTGESAPMAWMGHEVEGRMPGMASPEEIRQLSDLPVEQAETLFLQLMNRHHIAGVEMSEAMVERGSNDRVTELAEVMVRVQDREIQVMNTFLEQRGYEPVTPENVDSIVLATGPEATPAASPEEGHEDH